VAEIDLGHERTLQVESSVDDEFEAEQNFDQECLDKLVRLGMEELDAAFFLGRFLTYKTGESWSLIQIGDGNAPKFFVPTESLTEETPPLKN